MATIFPPTGLPVAPLPSPAPLCHFSFHTYLPACLSSSFSVSTIDPSSSPLNGCDQAPGFTKRATCALPFSHFAVAPFPFVFKITAPASLSHFGQHADELKTVRTALYFIVSLQAVSASYSLAAPRRTSPTCSVHSSENHLPLLILPPPPPFLF